MYYLFLPLIIILTACSTPKGNSDFYTWVDENGNLHTRKKGKEPEFQSNRSFDTSKYTPSVEIDKRLKNTKLYAWQNHEGNQVVIETNDDVEDVREVPKSAQKLDKRVIFKIFREGFQYQYSDLKGRELLLADYYRFNETASFDYFIINLDESLSSITMQSFIKEALVARPKIIPLNEFYEQKFGYEFEWNKMVKESWSSYGYFESQFLLPTGTQYLLIIPSEIVEPIIYDDNVIKITDLGSIVINSSKSR